jgi:hypothetical protein
MIDARTVALQGLTSPVNALLVALQGLWPAPATGGRGGMDFAPARRAQRRERTDEDDILSVIVALITSGILGT